MMNEDLLKYKKIPVLIFPFKIQYYKLILVVMFLKQFQRHLYVLYNRNKDRIPVIRVHVPAIFLYLKFKGAFYINSHIV